MSLFILTLFYILQVWTLGDPIGPQNGRFLRGNSCEYIKISSIKNIPACTDGTKFVIKQAKNTRKQFLMLEGEPIIAFVLNGKKFTDCESYTEVTSSVECKEVPALDEVDLDRPASGKFVEI